MWHTEDIKVDSPENIFLCQYTTPDEAVRCLPAGSAGDAPLYIYVEAAPLTLQNSILSAVDRSSGNVCYDMATLLPNVLPLAAQLGPSGCEHDVILSPLSTLLALGAPVGLTGELIKVCYPRDEGSDIS